MLPEYVPSEPFNAFLREMVRLNATPGVVIAATDHGKRIFAAAGHPGVESNASLTPATRIQLGCIAKLVTAIVALELAAAGDLDLGAPIEDYLPELRNTDLGRCVTPRHLLAHTSGYRGPDVADPRVRYFYSWDKLLALLLNDDPLFPPGQFFNYDHTESVLLGEILERLTTLDIRQLHRQIVLAPLGIGVPSASDQALGEHGYDEVTGRFTALRAAPGCVFWRASLSDDMLSLFELLQLAEAAAGLDRAHAFHETTIEALTRKQIDLPGSLGGPLKEHNPHSFALGCACYGGEVYGHNGSSRGQTCALRFVPSAGLAFVVALNVWRPHVRDLICDKAVLHWTKHAASVSLATSQSWDLPRLQGTYSGSAGAFADVFMEKDALICVLRNEGRISLRLSIAPDVLGQLALQCDAPQLTVGFSDNDVQGKRLMLIGLNAYSRHDIVTPSGSRAVVGSKSLSH